MRNPFFLVIRFLPYSGMAIFPFVLLKQKELKDNPQLIYHERIHLVQQLEMGIVFFYLFYLLHYLFNLAKYQSHDKAYREIVFEKEAYLHENDYHYIRHRPFWAFRRYL